MADIIQADPSQYSLDHLADITQPKFRDRYSILLVVLAIFALLTAVAVGIYTLFYYDGTVSPFEIQTLVILQAVFGILAIGLYITAVWRTLNNVSLQARAGCPSCQQHELMRISRNRRDRLMTLSGIRVARYQCRQCRWNGRRIFRSTYHPLLRMELHNDLDAAYVQPEVVPISKTATMAAQPESLPINFDTDGAIDDTVAAVSAAKITPDETEVEIVDFDLEPSDSDRTIVETGSTQTPEVLDHPSNGASILDVAASDTLTESVESARPIDTDTEIEAGDLDQEQALILGNNAKIVTTFGINLKAEPHSDSKWVGLLGPGTIVTLHKNKKLVDGTIWYFVDSEDAQSGWVASSCLESIE